MSRKRTVIRRQPPARPKEPAPPPQRPAATPPPPEAPAEGIPIFGRPKRPITREIIEKMCRSLRRAGTVEQAAVIADVSPSHFFRWQAEARAGVAAGTAPPEFKEFLEALEQAKVTRGLAVELQLQKHAQKDFRAAAFLAERLPETRERFRPPKVDLIIDTELTANMNKLREAFKDEPEIFDRILAAIAGEHGEGGAGGEAEGEGEGGGGPDDSAGGQAVQPPPAEPEAGDLPPA